MRQFAVVAVLLSLVHADPARAAPLRAAVGQCLANLRSTAPGYDLPEGPNEFEAYLQLNFATKLPDGWTSDDFDASLNETTGMEICIVNANTGVMSCPNDPEWKVDYTNIDLVGDYPGNQSELPSATTWVDLPVDWRLTYDPHFLIIRRNGQGGWQTLQSAVAENGFCLVPQHIGTSPDQHFNMIGVDTTMTFPLLSNAPPNGLGWSPCLDGNRTFDQAGNACVHESVPAYVGEHLEKAVKWQQDRCSPWRPHVTTRA